MCFCDTFFMCCGTFQFGNFRTSLWLKKNQKFLHQKKEKTKRKKEKQKTKENLKIEVTYGATYVRVNKYFIVRDKVKFMVVNFTVPEIRTKCKENEFLLILSQPDGSKIPVCV